MPGPFGAVHIGDLLGACTITVSRTPRSERRFHEPPRKSPRSYAVGSCLALAGARP